MKMKKKNLIVMLILCVALLLTACSEDEEYTNAIQDEVDKNPVPLVIIAGRHANARMYTEEDIEMYEQWFKDAIDKNGDEDNGFTGEIQIHLVINDGKPEELDMTYNGKNLTEDIQKNNWTKFESEIDDVLNNISDYLLSSKLMANDKETDLLEAICVAKRILLSNYPNEKGRILILDSGITTAGAVRMQTKEQQITANTNIEEYIDIIPESKRPKLEKTVVAIRGLGQVGGLQGLDEEIRKVLEDYYAKLIEEVGGTVEGTIVCEPPSANAKEMMAYEDGSGYPWVTPVQWQSESSGEAASPIPLFTTMLDFIPNEAKFKSEENAIAAISNYKEMLQKFAYENQNKQIYIVGSIARDDDVIKKYPDGCRTHKISHDRAEAVKNLLIQECKLNETQIVVVDAGATVFTWRNADEYPNGTDKSADSTAQEKNRLVMIIPDDENSSQCQSFIGELRSEGYIE